MTPALIPAGQGQFHTAFGDQVTFLLTGEHTGGAYTMFEAITPPGGGPPPHRHDREDEWFLVMEGQAEFLSDGVWKSAGPGAAAFIPRGAVHTFRNAGDTPLKMLVHTAPAGFETFFANCANEFAKEGGPEMEKIFALASDHGIVFEQ